MMAAASTHPPPELPFCNGVPNDSSKMRRKWQQCHNSEENGSGTSSAVLNGRSPVRNNKSSAVLNVLEIGCFGVKRPEPPDPAGGWLGENSAPTEQSSNTVPVKTTQRYFLERSPVGCKRATGEQLTLRVSRTD